MSVNDTESVLRAWKDVDAESRPEGPAGTIELDALRGGNASMIGTISYLELTGGCCSTHDSCSSLSGACTMEC